MLLTVFTPTYNRASELERTFKSLCAQSSNEFIWLIVDDGSTDGTGALVEGFKKLANFEIRYEYQENGGKMRAHNTGASLCDTELFLCLDSDDILIPEAVETIVKTWRDHENSHFCLQGSKERAGIVAYKGSVIDGSLDDIMERISQGMDIEDNIRPFAGASFSESDVNAGVNTLRGLYLNGFYGETTLVFKTSLLKENPFPEVKGEKYIPEDYVYDRIDAVAGLIVLPCVITVCELMDGGYTDSVAALRKANPTGWYLYYEQRLHLDSPFLLKYKYICHYIRFCQILGKKWNLPFYQKVMALPGVLALMIMGKT
jgi:glycosyltransferase involved in cell wall biosynthesis